ncbi:hypothetical protein ACFQZI_00495 [Mucilaginibacter lutimaris]|uniref:Outer membrane protein beta-barrel domain-containing protein n=1 Tax=Mucilaginibacter lutimaris TaxID=931629 RepID=A0ABW2ZB94_9SPHI
MKTLSRFLTYFSIVFTSSAMAQTTEFLGTVKLGPKAHVVKIVTIPDCPQPYTPPAGTAGTQIKFETKLTNGKTDITIKDKVTPTAGNAIMIKANKVLKILMSPNSEGKAELYTDDKDKTVLYVNYWLNGTNTVLAGQTIERYQPEYDCNGTAKMVPVANSKLVLQKNEDYYLAKVLPGANDMQTTWFKNSEHLRVYDKAGNMLYYLVDHYSRNTKYVLELDNRESINFNSASVTLGALVIPFKYRFGYKGDKATVKSDATAALNIGAFGGIKVTNYSIINKAGTYTQSSNFALRVGPFLNLATTSLDKTTTTNGLTPLTADEKQNIGVFSTGVGLTAEIKKFQFGAFGGWDFGLGPEHVNWNYDKRFWIGFGIGYKLTDLFSQ